MLTLLCRVNIAQILTISAFVPCIKICSLEDNSNCIHIGLNHYCLAPKGKEQHIRLDEFEHI